MPFSKYFRKGPGIFVLGSQVLTPTGNAAPSAKLESKADFLLTGAADDIILSEVLEDYNEPVYIWGCVNLHDTLNVPNAKTIDGLFYGSTFVGWDVAPTEDKIMMQCGNVNDPAQYDGNISIRNLTIQNYDPNYNQADHGQVGLRLDSCATVLLENLYMWAFKGSHLYLNNSNHINIINIDLEAVSNVDGSTGVTVTGSSAYNRFLMTYINSMQYGFNFGASTSKNQIIGFNHGSAITTSNLIVDAGTNNQYGAGNRDINSILNPAGGTATIASGATTVTVTHGLQWTPAVQDIILQPTNATAAGLGKQAYISAITSTTFTITVPTAPAASATFSWKII
jgi:hypothetical protein